MTPDPPRSPRWKRRIRWILVGLALLPVLAFLLSNALLATPWARGKVAGKISARCGGLESSVGRIHWSPWGGVVLSDLKVQQPAALRAAVKEPLLEMAEIRIRPRWRRILRGQLRIESITLDQPRGVLALEMAASLVSAGAAAPTPPSPPPVAVVEPTAPAIHAPAPESTAQPPGPQATPPAPISPAAIPPAAIPPAAPAETVWLEVREGSFELRLGGARMAALSAISGRIPLGGAPGSGRCGIGEMECLGRVIATSLELPLSWRSPELRCDAVPLRIAGADLQLTAALGLLRGLPFAADLWMPAQPLDGAEHFRTLSPAARQAGARVQGRGALRHPPTWEAVALAEAEGVRMEMQGQTVEFDVMRLVSALSGGVVHVPDIRMTGEQVSFLGNAHFNATGQGTGVLRAVMPPDLSRAWAARLTVDGKAPVFADLETPDRQFIDLRWISYQGSQAIELGEGGPVIPAAALAQALFPQAAR